MNLFNRSPKLKQLSKTLDSTRFEMITTKRIQVNPERISDLDNDLLDLLKANIEETGFYTPLIVIECPDLKGSYMLLDGHSRYRVLRELGIKAIQCLVVTGLTTVQQSLLMVGLSSLRGQVDSYRRERLISSLTFAYDYKVLSKFLPDPDLDLFDLSIDGYDFDELRRQALERQMQLEDEETERVSLLLTKDEAHLLRKGIQTFQDFDNCHGYHCGLVGLLHYALGTFKPEGYIKVDQTHG